MIVVSEPAPDTAHPDRFVNTGRGVTPPGTAPPTVPVEASTFQADIDRLCALLEARPAWVHRSDRPSWHPDDCNDICCWKRAP